MTLGCVSFRSAADFTCRKLTLEPVPVVVFTTTHPTGRVFNTRDVQGLLEHVKFGGSWLPIAQAVFCSMDEVVVAPVRSAVATKAAKTPFSMAMASSRAVI